VAQYQREAASHDDELQGVQPGFIEGWVLRGGYYDYNVDVLENEKHIHFAWQAHALYEWRKSDMVGNPPVTDADWKNWVNWNWAIPAEEKERLSNLSTHEWKHLWQNQDEFLEFDKEPLYYHT
jgi:hypothetical protein